MKTRIENIKVKLDQLKSEIDSTNGQITLLSVQINDNEVKLEEIKYDRELFKKAVEVINQIQDTTKQQIKQEIETLTTYALQSIMGDGYSFEINFKRKRNNLEVIFDIISPNLKTADGDKSDNLEDSESGFILDIVAIALKIILSEFCKEYTGNILILDEPFRNISQTKIENAMNFIKEISAKLNRQIIMVTHHEHFYINADNGIEISNCKKGERND